MQSDAKPENLFRTTYRDMRSPRFHVDEGFKTAQSWPEIETWGSELTGEVIEQHLDRSVDLEGQERRMLISVHSSSKRAVNYARVQRGRLFFDDTYQDPDVWIHVITTESLEWETISLTGQNEGKQMRLLRGPKCWFFSTADARDAFGSITSRWATNEEWFAIGHIPSPMVAHHIQLAFGQTLGASGTPYKLRPVPRTAVPNDLLRINGTISDALQDAVQRGHEMTEEEENVRYAEAMRLEEESLSIRRAHNDRVYTVLARGTQRRFGEWTSCVISNPDLGIFVGVLP